jgi:hypothetical protein
VAPLPRLAVLIAATLGATAAGCGMQRRIGWRDDIAAEARAQGHAAVLLRDGNAVAHFLKRGGPTAEERERIRRCLS